MPVADASLLAPLLPQGRPSLWLAPMQDVTDLGFWRTLSAYGGADLYVTEYFRVHIHSTPDKHILRSIDQNPTGRPVLAQLIGQDLPHLVRTARALQRHPISGIDLNLGCPAPVVCRKSAGGGLLRDPDRIHTLLTALRDAVSLPLTVKTRVGYADPGEFDRLIDLFARHPLDAVTVHGRTVADRYHTPVHLSAIRRAAACLPFPVIANGSVVCAGSALAMLRETSSSGLMIGRGAIRNPWIFRQIRDQLEDRPAFRPRKHDLLTYIERLYVESRIPRGTEEQHVQRMKKYLVYMAPGLDPGGAFDHAIRRVRTPAEFHAVCRQHLDGDAFLPDYPPSDSPLFRGSRELRASREPAAWEPALTSAPAPSPDTSPPGAGNTP